MNWEECELKRMVKKIKPDLNLAKSLKISSQKKLESAKRLKIDSVTGSSVVSLCYEALRELLEAIAVQKGFKVYNHECFAAFLKEIVKEEEIAISFDRFRQIRNRINYYGKDLSTEDAKDIKEEIIELIAKIGKITTT
jgi:hypothetical protein